jgi:hypothetical protein
MGHAFDCMVMRGDGKFAGYGHVAPDAGNRAKLDGFRFGFSPKAADEDWPELRPFRPRVGDILYLVLGGMSPLSQGSPSWPITSRSTPPVPLPLRTFARPTSPRGCVSEQPIHGSKLAMAKTIL